MGFWKTGRWDEHRPCGEGLTQLGQCEAELGTAGVGHVSQEGGWREGWVDGWMSDGWRHGQMDGWMDDVWMDDDG